jgi:hypothetical protein
LTQQRNHGGDKKQFRKTQILDSQQHHQETGGNRIAMRGELQPQRGNRGAAQVVQEIAQMARVCLGEIDQSYGGPGADIARHQCPSVIVRCFHW